MIHEGILPVLEGHLVTESDNYDTLAEIGMILFAVTARSDYLGQVKVTCIPERLTMCFVTASAKTIHKYQVPV